MTVKNCINVLLMRSGLTQKELSQELELNGQAAIAVPLSRNNGMGMKVETLIRWLDKLDADLVIQPRDGELEDEMLLDGE